MNEKGLIFDIQAFSVHDGPGCRTNVFFAGCPLRCKWCANPESFGNDSHIMFAENVCKWQIDNCISCHDVCTNGGISFSEQGKPIIDWNVCKKCTTFECVNACPHNALKMCGKEYTKDELMEILIRDSSNWGKDGGVTFTGGEPLKQYEFLLDVLKTCNKMQIHTAIETSGYADNNALLSVLQYVDFAFMDIKHFNPEKHKEGTGVLNQKILSNMASVKKSGWKGRFVLRQPTIGGFNDSDENAENIIAFMKANDLFEINLLKFHRFGQTKWEQLGKTYAYANCGDMTDEKMEHLQSLYLNNDIVCYIGDLTLF